MFSCKRVLPVLITGLFLAGGHTLADDCKNCGIVKSVNAVKVKGKATGTGAVAGGLVGGVLGNQIGKGGGRTLATVAGAAGGAYAGNEIEKESRSHTVWKIAVDMDYGERRSFTLYSAPSFAAGDRVRLDNGKPVRVQK